MRYRFAVAMFALVPLLVAGPAPAEEVEELRQRAMARLQEGEWSEAEAAFARLVEEVPDEAQGWAFLGLSRRNLERFEDARAAYERALALDPANVTALAGLAITLETLGETERALALLAEAARAGLPVSQLETAEPFAALRESEGFEKVLTIAERVSNPCWFEDPYDDFDFWLGDWDVTVSGQKRAENLITKEMNGCFVRESYANQAGYRGESINYYDPESGKWKQNWVDVGGGVTRYEGGLEAPGVMRMQGANAQPDGTVELARVTWTALEDGTVRHVIERSRDDGATWSVVFDAIYVRSQRDRPVLLEYGE